MTQPAFAQIAPISRRAIGYLIDALIAGGLTIVLGGLLIVIATLSGSAQGMLATLAIGGPLVSLLLLGWFVVYTLMQAGKGSIGMRAQGLRLVSARDDLPLGFGRTLLRNIIFGLSASIVVGYFTPLFDGSGRFQGWHDKVAGSLMLDARAAASPAGTASASASGSSSGLAPAAAAGQQFASGRPGPPLRPGAPAIPGIPQPASPAAPAQPATPSFGAPAAAAQAPAAQGVGQPMPAAPAAPAFPTPSLPPTPPRPTVPAESQADSGSLIAFVPGITQDAPPPRVAPVPAESDLDVTVRQPAGFPSAAPSSAPSVPVAPAASAPPASVAPAAAGPVAPTVAESVAPAASEPVAPEAEDLEDTRISIPGHRLVFTWDDGTRISVSRRTIFGRNPAPEEGAMLVPVRDETLSLSKTHFEAAAEPAGGWVLDRHSTNGMTIVREGQRIACPAGQRVPVRLGDAIEIGDRIVTIGGYA
ncbi:MULTISPECIES: RDD family protein [unclassified Microbacterium]|uniref:RDD family protein n=1 Tax=unclassified Microbacterium TaxID=2609290 RepID=UPI000EAA0461|nr:MULTISPECIES: RDD family protein [unclassified Microbacterium]MBT2484527.1 RDD family protein [Microbacterium sp. ISL-108]RKN67428.1 hypothetical protein D7252_07430 [Microbacterium sp. CGR2]